MEKQLESTSRQHPETSTPEAISSQAAKLYNQSGMISDKVLAESGGSAMFGQEPMQNDFLDKEIQSLDTLDEEVIIPTNQSIRRLLGYPAITSPSKLMKIPETAKIALATKEFEFLSAVKEGRHDGRMSGTRTITEKQFCLELRERERIDSLCVNSMVGRRAS